MKVIHHSCGEPANESEIRAAQHLINRLKAEPGDDQWVVLSNLAFSVTHQLQSDEIDLVVIGPPGVRVVEVKHWTARWAEGNWDLVEEEAERITRKAKKIGSTLRKKLPSLPPVVGVILLTQESAKVERLAGKQVRGISIYSLKQWKAAIQFDAPRVLSPSDIAKLSLILDPKTRVGIDGSLRRIAGYVNLELQTPKSERFHRVYKGIHCTRRDRVVLHLYDLSATDEKNAEAKAEREFKTLQRLQLYPWAPRVLDSFQPVPGYAGEMYFFTIVDPEAPTLEERLADSTWDSRSRLAFAKNALRSLRELHGAGPDGEPIIHRNINPRTVLVKHDNTPVFIGFERSRIPWDISIASSVRPEGGHSTEAPEVRSGGLAAADQRSDLYSLCACLVQLFGERSDEVSKRAVAILERGLAEQPEDRDSLDSLESAFAELLGESIPPPPAPPARFWTEDQIIRFGNHDYRIVSRLGSGGVGTTFKVVHVDRSTGEDLGTYVAKVAHDRETGERVRRSYARVRPYLRHTGLSTIFEIAKEWQENQFIALLSWIPGTPLSDFIGVFPLLAEEQQEPSTEALALRWIEAVCEALDVLHQHGLVHGDVSPRNLIVWGGDIVLTDYDFVAKVGEPMASPGTVLYCAPSNEGTRLASPSDDVYALAATFFHVVFEKEPFRYGEKLDKSNGLNWEGIPRDEFPRLASWLDQATNPDESMRFRSAAEAREALTAATSSVVQQPSSLSTEATELAESLTLTTSRPQEGVLPQQLRQERVEWLQRLLQSYPASPWGNQETRGLDSEFASETYVQTPLEEALLKDIRERRARLVILCGNAGDGKTALLQHLAEQLGLRRPRSAERILEVSLDDGLTVRMNLDGSASWRGRSADEILDDFLEPFQYGPPEEDLVHLLAINDGRLLEWIESVKERIGEETPLTDTLSDLVRDEKPLKNSYTLKNSYIRFINLNQRSLVGGINTSENRIDTTFLERLVDRLYGGDKAAEIWAPCKSCSAQEYCEVYRAALVFGPSNLGSPVSQEVRKRARERLFELLQAVHLRGETHITMRELRSALVYILFGVHFCDEYHEGQEALPYWDRAFSANSPYRQGEVLAELARFDPALEAHPQIDRYLQKETSEDSNSAAPSYPDLTVGSARRRAFFEWTEEYLEQVAGDPYGLGLARGRHLRDFRELPLMSPEEQSRICETLCKGISRLEELPPQALDRQGVVPLRVTPRTATETAFWVEKPLDAFRLEVDLPPEMEGLERLHRQVSLVYRYRSGHEERLRLGSDLFHHLLDLADGYQLGDISSDDTFAHLSIFVQRLVKEDERELLAWNPMQDETVYKVECRLVVDEEGPQQRLAISALAGRVAEQ